jgi:ketosteroid isomerase-like protein
MKEVPMIRIMLVLLSAAFVFGCGSRELSVAEIAKEKQAVNLVVAKFWKAYETKDAAAMKRLLSPSSGIMFFGSDSAEVMNSTAQWDARMKDDMQVLASFKAGEPRHLSTEIDSDGELASTVCEVPVDMTVGGQSSHALMRLAVTMKHESGEWHIVQGMDAFATVGQSSAELLAKAQAPQ